jgi:hypothetical protein
VILILGSAELRLFGIFPLERWQAQLFEMVLQKDLRCLSHTVAPSIKLM